MAFVIADRVKETTTTQGTGTVTLLGASPGYQSFSAIGNSNNTFYCIAGQTTSEWEVGIGTYTSSGTTLSRDTVLSSSNSGSLVNFSAGTKDVFVTYPSGRAVATSIAGTFTAAQTFRAASAIRSEAAATQDAVVVAGRAGGTSSYAVTLTPTTLSASRTVTFPDANIDFTTGLGVAQGGTGQTSYTNGQLLIGNTVGNTLTKATLTQGTGITITNGNGSITIAATATGDVTAAGNNAFTGANTFYNGTGQTFGTATSTQDGIIVAGRAGGSSSYRVTLSPGTLTASRSITFPNAAGEVVLDTATQTLTNKTIRQTVSVISGDANAAAGTFYVFTASLTLTLPGSPTAGDTVSFQNSSATTTAVIARNGSNIMSLAENMTVDATNVPATLVYADATRGWVLA